MTKRLMVAAAVLAAALLGAQSAAAAGARPVSVAGTYFVSDPGSTSDCAPAGALLRCTTTGLLSQYSGSLTGQSSADFTSFIDCKRGFTYGSGVETLTSPTGTLTWRIYFASAFNCTDFTISNFNGIGLIQSGTGQFRGAGGVLQFTDTTYRGVLTR